MVLVHLPDLLKQCTILVLPDFEHDNLGRCKKAEIGDWPVRKEWARGIGASLRYDELVRVWRQRRGSVHRYRGTSTPWRAYLSRHEIEYVQVGGERRGVLIQKTPHSRPLEIPLAFSYWRNYYRPRHNNVSGNICWFYMTRDRICNWAVMRKFDSSKMLGDHILVV